MAVTYRCFACETLTFTSKEELVSHIIGYHNIPKSNDLFMEPREQQINPEGSADVAMEVENDAAGPVQVTANAMEEAVYDENDIEDGASEDGDPSDLNDGEAAPATKPSVNFASTNDIKNIPEFMQEDDLLFPMGSTLEKGVAKNGRNRAQPIAWIDRNPENGGAIYTALTEAQRNDYKILASHRFRLNSPYPNTACSAEGCQEKITWRSAGVLKRKAKVGSSITAAYLKNVRTCFECRSMGMGGGQA
ncbi:hypothetical protein BGW39_007116 [Mortierella sp. 14UC]|nr:hypothetical protein BGW39_007116 [Mortierella sp. 14UC]